MKDIEKLPEKDSEEWKRYVEQILNSERILPSLETIKIIDLKEELAKIQAESQKSQSASRYQAVYDLHGMTRNEAHKHLETQLSVAKLKGHRCVLVITGKGHGKGEGLGILKRKVPLWLATPKFSKLVSSFEQARQEDGGEGALYVYLR